MTRYAVKPVFQITMQTGICRLSHDRSTARLLRDLHIAPPTYPESNLWAWIETSRKAASFRLEEQLIKDLGPRWATTKYIFSHFPPSDVNPKAFT